MNKNSRSNVPVKGKPLKPFISILKALLNDERFHRAIRWSENGRAIVISDGETFKKLVLDGSDEMFKTRNFTSFVRQLNLYGFKKVPINGKGDPSKNMKFEHQNFRRENPELMHLVQRNCNSRKKKKPENGLSAKQRTSKRACSFQAGRFSSKRRKNKYYTDCIGLDEDNVSDSDSEILSTSSSGISSERSTPTKEVTFSHSNSSYEPTKQEPFDPADVQEYMQMKLQDEQMAVQFLLSLRNAASFLPAPIPISTVTNYGQAPCPYYCPATPNFYPQYNHV